jgi:hypothetical protein
MNRSTMTIALAALFCAGSASAQGIPALGAAKAAANRAVNATNEHTHEETGQAITRKPVNGTAPATTAKTAATPAASSSQPSGARPAAGRDTTKKQAEAAPATSSLSREVFSYDAAARRDPFLSLLSTGELRPAFNDLKLVAVAYDPTGRKSVAVMRDVLSKDQYRVKVGQTLGRMRVAQIHPKSVTFTIDEFGYSRQDVLTLGDSTNMRNP